MTDKLDKPKRELPVYKTRGYLISIVVTMVVLASSVFFIWQMRSNAVRKIDTILSDSYATGSQSAADSTRANALSEIL